MGALPWFVCEDCPVQTNSEKNINEHADETGHIYREDTY